MKIKPAAECHSIRVRGRFLQSILFCGLHFPPRIFLSVECVTYTHVEIHLHNAMNLPVVLQTNALGKVKFQARSVTVCLIWIDKAIQFVRAYLVALALRLQSVCKRSLVKLQLKVRCN